MIYGGCQGELHSKVGVLFRVLQVQREPGTWIRAFLPQRDRIYCLPALERKARDTRWVCCKKSTDFSGVIIPLSPGTTEDDVGVENRFCHIALSLLCAGFSNPRLQTDKGIPSGKSVFWASVWKATVKFAEIPLSKNKKRPSYGFNWVFFLQKNTFRAFKESTKGKIYMLDRRSERKKRLF